MSETVLILARHGATASNLKRPYILQGQGVNHELDPLGVQQADALARELTNEPLAAVYASPLIRSLRTAEAAAKPHGLTVTLVPELIEANVGKWEGQSWDTIGAQWPDERALHDEDPSVYGYPSGESFIDVGDRSVPAMERIAGLHLGQTILIVAHNVVNRVAVAHWTGLPIRYCRKIPQNNAAYNIVSFREGRARVHTINVVRHLSGLLPPD